MEALGELLRATPALLLEDEDDEGLDEAWLDELDDAPAEDELDDELLEGLPAER